ncbi:MAG: 50S ribosomal protein L9 [Rickettsiales bacterium]|jgi:large subunit ribosomal protein L9|nr:50S ribosomal protein L9 [Rickettsiales bacterium]
MKIILNEKILKLGGIGDIVSVASGFARNYLLPNGKAVRFSKENAAEFEGKRKELEARFADLKSKAEKDSKKVAAAAIKMVRQAGDTGHLYGSVSSRDVARALKDAAGVEVESNQVMLGNPIKTIGAFDVKIQLHADVIVPVKVYVAQTDEEIKALMEGKTISKEEPKAEEKAEEKPAAAEAPEAAPEEKPKKPRAKKAKSEE